MFQRYTVAEQEIVVENHKKHIGLFSFVQIIFFSVTKIQNYHCLLNCYWKTVAYNRLTIDYR